MNDADVAAIVTASRELPLTKSEDPAFRYACLSFCVLDAVFSIGVQYTGAARVASRYAEFIGHQLLRPSEGLPPREDQQPLEDFVSDIDRMGAERFATEIVHNRQRTSSRSGVLKAQAARDFASKLLELEVHCLQDVPAVEHNPRLATAIRTIPGQSSEISLKYFLMLAGSDDLIKPDRWVNRFLARVLGRSVSGNEAQQLLSSAASALRVANPALTTRALDGAIWRSERQRDASKSQGQQLLEGARKAGRVVADRTRQGYGSAKKTVTQEDAFAEFGTYFAQATQVLSAQQARIAALEERVTRIEGHLAGNGA